MIDPSNVIYLKDRWEECRGRMAIDDHRSSERFASEAPAVIEDCETGRVSEGTVYNYGRGGMYLELDDRLKPGAEIRIDIEKPGIPSLPESCHARVVWCEEIPGAVVLYNFGVGVQHDLAVKSTQMADKFQVIAGGLIKDDSL